MVVVILVVVVPRAIGKRNMISKRIFTLLKHRWLDASDSRKAIPSDMAKRLMQRVAASEQRHSGEVRICVEASLPASYVWRHVWQRAALKAVVRERALMMFGKLRIWDTEHNNGVLIYLLLAEHAIEVIADRGISQRVSPVEWQAMVQRLGRALHERQFEDGLTQALEEVSALLVQHYPLQGDEMHNNELPNAPILG